MSILDAIGNTPLVEITHLNSHRPGVRIFGKLEGNNPGGSIKDRPALYMIQASERSGELTPDKTILEPTSGNTGIALAMIGAAKGYRVKLCMPECVSVERQHILQALGAEAVLTPAREGTDGAIRVARRLLDEAPARYYMPNQFANAANWQSHYSTTAPEIARDTVGDVHAVVAGMGTTGTLMGLSRYFREKSPSVKVIGVEPELNHRIQGLKNMNESIVPAIYDPALLDGKVVCSDDSAFNATRELALKEGLFCGISSGAALWGAIGTARDLPRGSTVVVIFPDRGDRYLSTEVFRSVCALCPP
jgi:S-sulfo-L-cysteine synthase (O-acetyl-L-serine-dependent)